MLDLNLLYVFMKKSSFKVIIPLILMHFKNKKSISRINRESLLKKYFL
jgi:hypothetical protein